MKKILLSLFLVLCLFSTAKGDYIMGGGGGGGISSYADVVAVFGSGACSGYLKSDGTCSTPGGTVTSSGTPTNHQWPGWTTSTNLKGFTITASKPVCSDANGDPAVCAGTEGVWQPAGSYSPGTFSDYQFIPVEAALDSVLSTPNVATRFQGTVGSTIAPVPANVTYGTFTFSGANVTNAVWGSGTQTATLTINPIVVGKLYQLNLTPTVTGQVPTITATSGMIAPTIPTIVTATVETIYFRATATTAVFTFTNTAASTWSTASTTCYEYTRPVMGREFSNTVQQTLHFPWTPPSDWNGGTIIVTPIMVVSNATAPANTETVVWSMAGYCVTSSDSLSQALGTAQTSTFTADATYLQYDEAIAPATSALTLNNAGTGKLCKITVDRTTTGTYAQPIALTGINVKFSRTLAP